MKPTDKTVYQRIDERIIKEFNGCWSYKGAHNHRGYPVISNGRPKRINRIQFERYHRKLNKSECVLHICDNKGCINPAHLKAGTDLENKNEMFERGLLLRGSNGRFKSPKQLNKDA